MTTEAARAGTPKRRRFTLPSAYTILFDLWKERTAITLSSSRWSGERNLVPSSTTFPTL